MSVNTAYPPELEQRQLHRHQYCRGCILFLKYAKQQHPMLAQQAGVLQNVYGHPVLILATHIEGERLNCVRVAVITSRGGHEPPSKWAHEYLPIWPKPVTCSDAPQLFLGEGRTLPKESYVCLRNTWDFDYSMLSSLWERAESYHFHLTRKSFNLVAERLNYPPMKLLGDIFTPEPMTVPPARVGINLRRTADSGKPPILSTKPASVEQEEAAYQSEAQEEKQWMQEYLQRRLKNPGRVAQYLAAWEKDNKPRFGSEAEPARFIPPEGNHRPALALSRPPGEQESSTFPEARQPVPLSPLSQVNITSSSPSLTPESVHDLMQRLQTISPPQLTKEAHQVIKSKGPGSKNGFATACRLEAGEKPSQQAGATPMLSLYDFSVLSLVLLSQAMWFFLKVSLVLTYRIVAWFLLEVQSRTPRTIRVWMKETKAAMEKTLQFLAAEAKKSVKEVLDQQ